MSFLYSPLLVSSHFVCLVFIWSLLLLLLILSHFFSSCLILFSCLFSSCPISYLLILVSSCLVSSFSFHLFFLIFCSLFLHLFASHHYTVILSLLSGLISFSVSSLSFFFSSFLFFLILLRFILSRFISSQVSFTRKERCKKERERTSVNSSRLSNDNMSEAYKPHTTELCCPSLSVSSKDKVVHEELEALQKPAFVSVCAGTHMWMCLMCWLGGCKRVAGLSGCSS